MLRVFAGEIRMRRPVILAALALTVTPALASSLSLEQIMANPDWIGPPVEQPYWSAQGHALYYSLKRDGSQVQDLYRVNLSNGKSTKLSDTARASADGAPVFDLQHRHAAFVRHGDIFIRNLASGTLRQVTRTPQRESAPQWSADGQTLQYRHNNQWYSYNLSNGLATSAATLKTSANPQDAKPGQMQRLQMHLFKTLRSIKHDNDAEHAQQQALDAADATRAGEPYLSGQGREGGRHRARAERPLDAGGHAQGVACAGQVAANHALRDQIGVSKAREGTAVRGPQQPRAGVVQAAGSGSAQAVHAGHRPSAGDPR